MHLTRTNDIPKPYYARNHKSLCQSTWTHPSASPMWNTRRCKDRNETPDTCNLQLADEEHFHPEPYPMLVRSRVILGKLADVAQAPLTVRVILMKATIMMVMPLVLVMLRVRLRVFVMVMMPEMAKDTAKALAMAIARKMVTVPLAVMVMAVGMLVEMGADDGKRCWCGCWCCMVTLVMQ